MMQEWIIGICNTGADGVSLFQATGTKEEIKALLVKLVDEDAAKDEVDHKTDSADEVADMGEELYAYGSYHDYHIDYTARAVEHIPEMECGEIESVSERYVVGQDFNTKDWFVYDNETDRNMCYFDTEQNAKEYVKRKVKREESLRKLSEKYGVIELLTAAIMRNNDLSVDQAGEIAGRLNSSDCIFDRLIESFLEETEE